MNNAYAYGYGLALAMDALGEPKFREGDRVQTRADYLAPGGGRPMVVEKVDQTATKTKYRLEGDWYDQDDLRKA